MTGSSSGGKGAWGFEDFVNLVPAWKGRIRKTSILTGGITNKLYLVELVGGPSYVVRIYGKNTDLFIDREIEAENIRRLHPTNIVPKLFGFFPDQQVTIVQFIPGTPLTNQDFLRDDLLKPIVKSIKAIHTSGLSLPKIFNPWTEIQRLWRILQEFDGSFPEFAIAVTMENLERLFTIAEVSESDYVPCHNDLLADNFILRQNFQSGEDEIALIDWEYAGMSSQYYEISDMFQEILVPREVEDRFIEAYWVGEDILAKRRLIDIFKPFPDIFWFLWSLIQLQVSEIEFDYYEYGRVKYENAQENIRFVKQEHRLSL